MVDFSWTNSVITLRFVAADDGPVCLVDISTGPHSSPAATARVHQPLVEILTPQLGNTNSSNSGRHSGTYLGRALRYVGHSTSRADRRESPGGSARQAIETLSIEQQDVETGLTVVSTFEALDGVRAVRTTATVSLSSDKPPLTLWAVTSFATGAVISADINSVDVWRADSSWSAENRWARNALRPPGLGRIDASARGETCRSSYRAFTTSTWSADGYLPAGAVQDRHTGRTLAWQVEHNGGWLWEVGERPGWSVHEAEPRIGSDEPAGPPADDRTHDGGYVAVLGPTDALHHWSFPLRRTGSFTSVPVTFTAADSFDRAFGHLADHRRATRRPHPQNDSLPVVFNDYMDTLEGDPSESKLLPLIDAAARVGCEYFCIDAGWYDDTAGWWASVGDWIPSTVRFPHGLASVLDHIRTNDMIPGLWLEPEVVGINSAAAAALPDSAFLQRDGVRIRERDRYLLDLRSLAARAHLDAVVDRLVGNLGVGYFKLDYNVTPGPGTDLNAPSVGQGLLEHNRALLTWLDGVLDRHPTLILENCGSGSLRSDSAMLGHLQLQSTSDQQDPLLYPAIAVGALVHILPEQAANWAYPQASMSDDMIAFTMCTGLAGRLYLSGLLDRMNAEQLALVAAGVQAHKDTRSIVARSRVTFPTGLPSWNDEWVTVAFVGTSETYVIAWRQATAPGTVVLDLPHQGLASLKIEQVYPPVGSLPDWAVATNPTGLTLTTDSPAASARMLRITTH